MAVIQEIWLLTRQGIILFNLRLDDTPIRQEMLGGFLAAITNLSKELDKSKTASVLLGATRLSVIDVENHNLIVAARTAAETAEKKINGVLLKLKQRILEYITRLGTSQSAQNKISTIGTAFQFDEGLTNIFLDML
ncbi:MAG TPA: hypothetical protein VKK79_07750 [Candidatus Lokiarchaeia archaeon]|nr:hypothetical protein [Candidatus Lokiarchaeia archaeon]